MHTDCRSLMNEALVAIEQWGRKNPMFSVDAAPECTDTWSRDYAIITLELDAVDDSPYIDSAQALYDLRQAVSKVCGPSFNVEYGTRSNPKRKPGDRVCQFHLHEVEIYRVPSRVDKA